MKCSKIKCCFIYQMLHPDPEDDENEDEEEYEEEGGDGAHGDGDGGTFDDAEEDVAGGHAHRNNGNNEEAPMEKT